MDKIIKKEQDKLTGPKNIFNLYSYMNSRVFWHIISNQYFPFLLHNKYQFRAKEYFDKIKADLRKEEHYNKKTLLAQFADHNSFRDFSFTIRDILIAYTKSEFQAEEFDEEYMRTFLNYSNTSQVPYHRNEYWQGINIIDILKM